ncbi:hypothetical protein [Vreelandella sulfidaeris]|uniref:Uncharacterized protein n=1 Tax=Vreelandella sulfidaeris TaxID=115553 RepID=A0A455U871_9GAMM|nr:hypothetical protein HSBAA_30330 [Halomonas sulfidaeris]
MEATDDFLFPEGEQDDFTRVMRNEHEYVGARRLPDGTYIGLQRLMFTLAICVGVTETSPFKRRYCFEDAPSCITQFLLLSSPSDEITGWIATRPKHEVDE